jgi:3-hydroxyacyl-CoA dehydrogenase
VTRIAIVGTGTMARDLGAYYLAHGVEVVVAGADPGRVDAAFAEASRKHRRLVRTVPDADALPPPRRLLLGEDPPIEVDVALECTAEPRAAKRAVCEAARELLAAARIVATNSSSLLPAEVWPGSVGAHHFRPMMLTRLAEIVADDASAPGAVDAMCAFAEAHGISVLRQDERNAFAANRLLLPLQNEAFRLLRAGVPAPTVDALTASPLLSIGQLSLLDTVGLDVVRESVANYVSRMPLGAARALDDLCGGLDALARSGKLGRKNGDGLLVGAPLPWPAGGDVADLEGLRARLHAVFCGSCTRMLDDGELGGEELALVLTRVFGAEDGAVEAHFRR